MAKPIPTIPVNLFVRPFADDGQKATIPDLKPFGGRASLTDGFPPETQLPLNQGGVAPNRLDFNGMFNMLSVFSYWQQSGGLFRYLTELNYNTPAIVVHNNMIWWCLKENGPDSVNGLRTPGAANSVDYWKDFFTKIVDDLNTGGGGGGGGTDEKPLAAQGHYVGEYVWGHWTTAPKGTLACNGQSFSATQYPNLYRVLGSANVPDYRGYFVRGVGGMAPPLGQKQGDAIRNITGATAGHSEPRNGFPTGAFASGANYGGNDGGGYPLYVHSFDASRVVPTANENRPINFSALICIAHD